MRIIDRRRGLSALLPTASLLVFSAAAAAQAPWLNLVNESSSRLVAKSSVVVSDNLEKDFAIGDFNKDGWVDVVMARKFPGSITGGFSNVLFLNEGGVLVDRTVEYASQSDQAGYQGFLDPTNDRDVVAIDIDKDGWLDLVTCTTMSDGLIDIIGQPRVYRNLGSDGNGNWLGFKHIRDRLPHLLPPNGNPNANPRFCAVASGDFNNDGFPDLFFVDYDTPETGGVQTMDLNNDGDTNDPGETQDSPGESVDFNNKLVFNYGTSGPGPGYFYDTNTTICTTTQLASAFGNAVAAGDFSGDGKDDIARVSTLGGSGLDILTRKNTASGFLGLKNIYSGAPYNTEKGDLNGDGKLDLVVADDGVDAYLINTGNDVTGQPNFTQFSISQAGGGFGNTIRVADWDKDGRPDVVIVDIDADLPSFCPTTGRRTHIYRNTYAGNNNDFLLETSGAFSKPFTDSQLEAWFDVAPMDLDGDGWLDMIVGRCAGVEVWMNRQVNATFSYPSGRPTIVAPGASTSFPVAVTGTGGGSLVPSSVKLAVRVNGGPWTESVMPPAGGNTFTATLPAADCGDSVEYYVMASMSNGGPYRDPVNAPYASFGISVGSASVTALNATFESGLNGFVVSNTAVPGGMKGFEVATPIATTLNGKPCAPGTAAQGAKAMVTMNGTSGGAPASSDMDGGPTTATSPVMDLSGLDHPTLSYSRWYFCDDTMNPSDVDAFVVEVSNNGGGSWTVLESVDYHGANAWKTRTFDLSSFIAITSTMQVRFRVQDNPENSITEAAFDNVVITGAECTPVNPCPADVNSDGVVDGADLGLVIGGWGQPGASDVNADGTTDGADLGLVIGAWGACN